MRLQAMVLGLALLAPDAGGYRAQVEQARQERANTLSGPEDWLSLVALEWLKPGDTTVGSGAGENVRLEHAPEHLMTLHVDESGAVSVVSAVVGTTVNGRAVAPGPLSRADGNAGIRQGSLVMTVIRRGDRQYLRVKDAYAKTRVRFKGLAWYPVDPKLHVIAKWIPATTPITLTIPNVLGQVSQDPSPGVAEFMLGGQTIRLAPIQEDKESLFFIFRDTTARTATYGSGRFLHTPLPSNGLTNPGTVDMDFNLATNPPCAYTPYATCPLPPEQNRLTVAIAAGEKRYEP
jgi:uncharacterized protein (DUF1684 family)